MNKELGENAVKAKANKGEKYSLYPSLSFVIRVAKFCHIKKTVIFKLSIEMMNQMYVI